MAKDHLDRAEQLLEQARGIEEPGFQLDVIGLAVEAIGHVLVVVAAELGAPHASGPVQVASDASQ